ncbi:hypothetical protein BUALT_Bualt05G0135100 [Buddleja alternifolia]|uniref:5'-deoxynucleotidase n=1 Tax=Buddleja alternifolia TaxID=168488 RepID=A0AAV6XKH5_9LAMI|nr:hypothetical protein BUALT_Bualt05G0135100 [Buddleja alternifolia]
MASVAASKLNPYSPSRYHVSPIQSLNFSHKFTIKIPFLSDPQNTRLFSVHSHNPNLDSIEMDQNVPGFGSGTQDPTHLHEPGSPSAAIDFLTLCHSLKVCVHVYNLVVVVLFAVMSISDGFNLSLSLSLLQSTKRKGWVNHGIKGPESIADHMYRMSLMALIADDLPGVNRERCIKIAIVHDIAEAIVGDITPSDGVPKEQKSRMEQEALDEMCKVLGGGMRAEEIKELWREYENNSSLEANLVKDFDKVEMILQALEYETEHGKVLDEFFLSAAGKIQTEIGKRWAAEITSRRNSRLANKPS